MKAGRGIWALLLVAVAMLLGTSIPADTIVTDVPGQGQQQFGNVVVLEIARDPNGVPWLKVAFPDTSIHSVPLTQVRSISFGDSGEGRSFDAMILNENQPVSYPQSLFRSFDGTRFVAQPPEETELYYLDPKFIAFMMATSELPGGESLEDGPGLMPSDAPAPPGTAPSGEEVPKELQEILAELEKSQGSGGSAAGEDARAAMLRSLGMPEEMIARMPAQSGSSMLLGLLVLVFWVLAFVTAVWSSIQAFRYGHTLWGLGIVFTIWSCCCSCIITLNSLVKVFFMRAYDGPDKKILNIVLTVEAFLGFAIIILTWMQQ